MKSGRRKGRPGHESAAVNAKLKPGMKKRGEGGSLSKETMKGNSGGRMTPKGKGRPEGKSAENRKLNCAKAQEKLKETHSDPSGQPPDQTRALNYKLCRKAELFVLLLVYS